MTKEEAHHILDTQKDGTVLHPAIKIRQALRTTGDISRALPTHTDHLILMASTNGWKAHAWHRAKEMDNDTTGIWKGISQDLTNRMKAINEPISDK